MAAILNAMQVDPDTGRAAIAAGATGFIRVDIETNGTLNPGVDKAVFAIGDRKTYETVMRRAFEIAVDGDGYYVMVELANEDTRVLEPGRYVWTLIVVTDPAYGEGGEVIVDERSDGVYPLWQGKGQPEFIVEGVAKVV